MSVYVDLIKRIEEFKLKKPKAFEAALNEARKGGARSWKYYETNEEDTRQDICERFCYGLIEVANKLDSIYEDVGIQQFSLNLHSDVGEEDVKKALFLSRTATIFTPHEFSYSEEREVTEDEPTEYHHYSWSISHDYLRQIYNYKDAILEGGLIILPSSIKYHTRYYWEAEVPKIISLLDEMKNTRVMSIRAESEIIDKIIARYKTNHQLIRLPDIYMPWMKNIDLKSVLKVRNEQGDLLKSFQTAYHKAILENIENHRSLNFQKISKQIHGDLIEPKVNSIEKKYKRTISLHRSLSIAGAIVSILPIAGVILSGTLFKDILGSDMGKMISPTIAGLVSSVSANKIHQKHQIKALEDEDFYILWRLKKGKLK
jgi:hypothetical protein